MTLRASSLPSHGPSSPHRRPIPSAYPAPVNHLGNPSRPPILHLLAHRSVSHCNSDLSSPPSVSSPQPRCTTHHARTSSYPPPRPAPPHHVQSHGDVSTVPSFRPLLTMPPTLTLLSQLSTPFRQLAPYITRASRHPSTHSPRHSLTPASPIGAVAITSASDLGYLWLYSTPLFFVYQFPPPSSLDALRTPSLHVYGIMQAPCKGQKTGTIPIRRIKDSPHPLDRDCRTSAVSGCPAHPLGCASEGASRLRDVSCCRPP